MINTIQKARLLKCLGLFNFARDLININFVNKSKTIEFYGHFIKPGQLCFDIGANIGQKTEVFSRLGTKVIAVEPQPECVSYLKKKYKNNKNVHIVQACVDESIGERELYVCEINSLSSLSQNWINQTKKSGRHKDFNWDNKITVPAITLDKLIKEFGIPAFCKIDVEGWELNVLKGLSQKLPHISIEIAPETVHHVSECLNYLKRLGEFTYNHSIDSQKFIFGDYQNLEKFNNHLKSSDLVPWGDIYIKS